MPLQELSGEAIFVSLEEYGFSPEHNLTQGNQLCSHRQKLGLRSTSSNALINHTNTEKIPGLLLFVDLEKAFDSIEWSFIEKTLKYYNFGTSLVTWVEVFYTDISSCVLNNGWSSDFFN